MLGISLKEADFGFDDFKIFLFFFGFFFLLAVIGGLSSFHIQEGLNDEVCARV